MLLGRGVWLVYDDYAGAKVIENAADIGDAIPMSVLFFSSYSPHSL